MRFDKKFQRQTGLMLMELIIGLGILVATSIVGYQTLRGGFTQLLDLSDGSQQRSDHALVTALMGRDLRCASAASAGSVFAGHPDETGSDELIFNRFPSESVRYFVKQSSDNNRHELWRETNDGRVTFLCANVFRFHARYFDGHRWTTDWGWDNENRRPFQGIHGLPQLVSIHLDLIDNDERHHTFSTVIPVMTSLLNARL